MCTVHRAISHCHSLSVDDKIQFYWLESHAHNEPVYLSRRKKNNAIVGRCLCARVRGSGTYWHNKWTVRYLIAFTKLHKRKRMCDNGARGSPFVSLVNFTKHAFNFTSSLCARVLGTKRTIKKKKNEINWFTDWAICVCLSLTGDGGYRMDFMDFVIRAHSPKHHRRRHVSQEQRNIPINGISSTSVLELRACNSIRFACARNWI